VMSRRTELATPNVSSRIHLLPRPKIEGVYLGVAPFRLLFPNPGPDLVQLENRPLDVYPYRSES